MTDPVYRERDFRLFLGVRIISTLAVMIQSVAVGWQVYDMERTPLALAWVGLAEFVPMFLLTLPAGAWSITPISARCCRWPFSSRPWPQRCCWS